MSNPFRSTDPLTFNEVDGIVIDESAPPANVQGVPANIAILVGRFQRGPENEIKSIGSIGELHELFGKADFSGNNELKNKKWGSLRVVRAVASAAAKAELTLVDDDTPTPADALTIRAKYLGAYGNEIEVKVEDGTDSVGKKYTFRDTSDGAVLSEEVFDQVIVVGKTQAQLNEIFGSSKLVDVIDEGAALEPDNIVFTALAGGSEGTIADTDYEDAIQVCETDRSGNILFCDKQSATIKGYLKAHLLLAPDKMVVIGPDSLSADKAAAIADVATYRDTEGRIIYAYNPPKTVLGGVEVETSPVSWVASILSNIGPNIDPAFAENVQFMAGSTGLKFSLSRQDYIDFKNAGIAAFENDPDLGIKLRSGIVTQIVNSSKVTILRRRMADFLTNSIGFFLKNYQNAPNTAAKRREVAAAITAWDDQLIRDGILPSDSEVSSGLARLIDAQSLNTDNSIGQGFFKLLYKRRIYSSMRFIVLQAEIGETVVVTEGE